MCVIMLIEGLRRVESEVVQAITVGWHGNNARRRVSGIWDLGHLGGSLYLPLVARGHCEGQFARK